jgi:hypothetical protein
MHVTMSGVPQRRLVVELIGGDATGLRAAEEADEVLDHRSDERRPGGDRRVLGVVAGEVGPAARHPVAAVRVPGVRRLLGPVTTDLEAAGEGMRLG